MATQVLLWLALAFEVLAFGVGASWDRRWHATHPFEDFFSPPHLFIYTMHLVAMLMIALLAADPERRRRLGAAILFPVAGVGVVGLAGVFDGIWHTAFGLDETAWSTPHSMLAWGVFLTFLGLAAARLALREEAPVGWISASLFGFTVFAASVGILAGPIGKNFSPDFVRAVAALLVLAVEEDFQHTARIEIAWNLTRQNLLFVPLSAASVGLALGLLRAIDRRPLVVLALTTIVSRTDFVPVVLPGVIAALHGARAIGRPVWLLTGFGYGIVTAVIWRGAPISALAAAPLMLGGALVAERIATVVIRPTPRGILLVVTALGIGVPLLTGALDLYLLTVTP